MMTREDVSVKPGLHRSMKWGLAATLVATAMALLWPAPAVVGVRTTRELAVPKGSTAISSSASSTNTRGRISLIEDSTRSPNLRPFAGVAASATEAVFDPFVGVAVETPASAVALTASVPEPARPPPPPPPVQDYRFFGRVIGPDGGEQILLARGESFVSITKGTVLDNGYVVESISAESVVVVFPSLGIRTSVPIPPNSP